MAVIPASLTHSTCAPELRRAGRNHNVAGHHLGDREDLGRLQGEAVGHALHQRGVGLRRQAQGSKELDSSCGGCLGRGLALRQGAGLSELLEGLHRVERGLMELCLVDAGLQSASSQATAELAAKGASARAS